MKNVDKWAPSKYVLRGGQLRASRDSSEVGVASRLIADRVAAVYGKYLPKFARGRLLDLGCGKVPLFLAYRDHVDDVTCVDWGSGLHDTVYLDVEQDISEELPFADGDFDTIILSDVLEHIAEPTKVWSQLARLLGPDGYLLLNVPYYYPIHEEPYDYYRYTEFALRRFATDAGLDLVILEPLGGSPEILADLMAKNVAALPIVGPWLAALVQAAASLLTKTGPGMKLSAKTAKWFPLGYFLVAQKPAAPGEVASTKQLSPPGR